MGGAGGKATRAKRTPSSRSPQRPPVSAAPPPSTAAGNPTTIIIQQQQSQSGGPVPNQAVLAVALILAAVPAYIAFVTWASGAEEAPIPFLVFAGGCAMVSIVLSLYAMWGYWSVPGYAAAKGLAVVALTFGMLSFGLFVVIPLIALLFCRPPPSSNCSVDCPDCACSCDCDPCAGGCCGSGEPCDPCGNCCGGSSSSGGCGGGSDSGSSGGLCGCGSSSGGGSGSGGGGGSTPAPGALAAGSAFLGYPLLRGLALPALRERLKDGHFAHHPDLPQFAADVFRVRGVRICVGCAVVFPAFLLVLPFESLLLDLIQWRLAFAVGVLLVAVQLVSALGLTKWRWSKVLVKSCLGIGLALFLVGVRASPWPIVVQALIVGAMLALALASAMPRRRRIAAALEVA